MRLMRANNAWVKGQNITLVLNLVREMRSISRAEISKKTGLSRSTVSQVINRLLEAGIIEETGSGESIGGRRPIILRIRPEGRWVCAAHVDDNGQIHMRVEDLIGNEVKRSSGLVKKPDELVPVLTNMIKDLSGKELNRIVCITLALPGIISLDGCILSAVNLGWKSVPVGSQLTKNINIPVLAENATGLAAYGELDIRAINSKNLVYVRIESAVGAGIVTDHKLYHGLRGSEVEIGHMVVDMEGKPCKCGRKGCLETRVSRAAVCEILTDICKVKSLEAPDIDENNIFEWLVAQDNEENLLAQGILKTVARNISVAIVNVLNLMGADTIVIQSKLCDSKTFWMELNQLVFKEVLPFARGGFEIMRSISGEDAILQGATAYARQYFFEKVCYKSLLSAESADAKEVDQ